MIGHLSYLCNGLDRKSRMRYDEMKLLYGDNSISFAWVFQQQRTDRDRAREIGIETGKTQIYTENRSYMLLDAPGHRDFVKNLITGVCQGDFAILVVAAPTGEFEAGISKQGQTREQALLAYSLGDPYSNLGTSTPP